MDDSDRSAGSMKNEINKMLLDTILQAEKILLDLPRSRNEEGKKKEKSIDESNRESERSQRSQKSSKREKNIESEKEKDRSKPCKCGKTRSSKSRAEIIPNSIRVEPLNEMMGIVVDVGVRLKLSNGGDRVMEMRIECPQYVPKRIRVDGKWRNIV